MPHDKPTMASTNAAANARKAGDKADSDYLVRETNATFLRSGGVDWNSWSK